MVWLCFFAPLINSLNVVPRPTAAQWASVCKAFPSPTAPLGVFTRQSVDWHRLTRGSTLTIKQLPFSVLTFLRKFGSK